MKRPVWHYRVEATTDAPLAVVRARLAALDAALPLSVCAPRLGTRAPKRWRQEAFAPAIEADGVLQRSWTARLGGLHKEASLRAEARPGGCLLHAEGRLKGWPLLWKVGLLGWRSEGLLARFVAGL